MASDLSVDLSIDPNDYEGTQVRLRRLFTSRYVTNDVPARFQKRIDLPPAVEQWAKSGGSLYLTGSIGTGKTHAAWEVIQRVRERMAPNLSLSSLENSGHVSAWRATALLDALRPGSDDARTVVEQCQDAPLLLLDDLGAEKPSEWTQERLYEVIDDRYAWERPVIITSNVPPKSLGEWVGDRVASRLAEMCDVIALTGADRRRS